MGEETQHCVASVCTHLWGYSVTHPRRPGQPTRANLEAALEEIIRRAAVQFPADQPDVAKWEWAHVLAMTCFEAAKRWNLPVDRIVERAFKVTERRLERQRAADILTQEVPEFPAGGHDDEAS